MKSTENFLNLLVCSVLVSSVILVLILLVSSSCSSPELETPVLRNISILAPDSMPVSVDGLLQGYTPLRAAIITENYPNYVEIGPWSFVWFPPCDYDAFSLKADSL